jgi:hypothetical protein
VVKPPLSGSVLWYAWPNAAAAWGSQPISIEAGTYTLAALAGKLKTAGLDLAVPPDVKDRRVTVVAEDIPIRSLLWAVEVATSVQVKAAPGAQPAALALQSEASPMPAYNAEVNALLPIPGLGYFSASDSDVGQKLLSTLLGGSPGAGGNWIGWRLADLPLLCRNEINDAWRRTQDFLHEALPPIEPERTYVLWSKSILLSVDYQMEDLSGGGIEFPLPAL